MPTLLIVALLAGFEFHQGSPPQGPPPQTASIRGRVVDKVTGAPLARAVVVLRRVRVNHRPRQTLTDADGRFALTDLVPDSYDLSATAGEFRASHVEYGPGADKPLQLKPGEVREVSIALVPALAISGRVVDQAGLPLSGARIDLRDFATGYRSYRSQMRQTDDLGSFRIFGLPAGRYRLCAEGNVRPQFTPATGKRHERFVKTCYPSAIGGVEAAPIVVSASDVEGVEIRMQRRPTFTISGIVLDSTGSPAAPSRVGLMHIELDGASGTSHPARGSAFAISNVVPGRYVVSAEIGPELSPDSRPVEKGVTAVEVTSEDVENLVVTMRKGVRVRGTVTFEDGPPPDLQLGRLEIETRHVDLEWGAGRDSARLGADLAFELKDLFGPYVLALSGLPMESTVKSILYRSRDVLNVPTEFDGDPRNAVEIVVTSRVAQLSGRVLDERGNPTAGARVYVFPADPATWKGWMVGPSTSGKDGSFRRRLAAGDYLTVAISSEDQQWLAGAPWYRPNPHARLAPLAERVTLLDDDRRTIDLRLSAIPEEWKR